MRADKKKIIDEVWDDTRIDSFLDKEPMGDEPAAFSQLLNAYRSMRLADFEIFLQPFKAQGGDVSSTNNAGQTLCDIIQTHRKSASFIALLNA